MLLRNNRLNRPMSWIYHKRFYAKYSPTWTSRKLDKFVWWVYFTWLDFFCSLLFFLELLIIQMNVRQPAAPSSRTTDDNIKNIVLPALFHIPIITNWKNCCVNVNAWLVYREPSVCYMNRLVGVWECCNMEFLSVSHLLFLFSCFFFILNCPNKQFLSKLGLRVNRKCHLRRFGFYIFVWVHFIFFINCSSPFWNINNCLWLNLL